MPTALMSDGSEGIWAESVLSKTCLNTLCKLCLLDLNALAGDFADFRQDLFMVKKLDPKSLSVATYTELVVAF